MQKMSFVEAVRSLSRAQKSNKGAPIYSRLINRPLGRVFAAFAYQLGMTPNQVTVVSAACTYTAIALIALIPASVGLGVGVGLLLMLGYALDSSDGQLARLRGGGSVAGEWMDHVADAIKLATIHSAVLIQMYRFWDIADATPALMLIPIVFGAVQYVLFFVFILTDKIKRANAEHRLASQDKQRPSILKSIIAAPHDYGLLCLTFLLLGVNGLFLVIYAVLMVGSAAYLGGVLIKNYLYVSAM